MGGFIHIILSAQHTPWFCHSVVIIPQGVIHENTGPVINYILVGSIIIFPLVMVVVMLVLVPPTSPPRKFHHILVWKYKAVLINFLRITKKKLTEYQRLQRNIRDR